MGKGWGREIRNKRSLKKKTKYRSGKEREKRRRCGWDRCKDRQIAGCVNIKVHNLLFKWVRNAEQDKLGWGKQAGLW